MKLTTKTLISLFSLCVPLAAFAETLTIEGDLEVSGAVSVPGSLAIDGSLLLNNVGGDTSAGSVRWTGTDFEGYDGSTWRSLTANLLGHITPYGIGGLNWSNRDSETTVDEQAVEATIWGHSTAAVGDYSTAWGWMAYAGGESSTAFGIDVYATSMGAVAVGSYNRYDFSNSGGGDVWRDLDSVFDVGIGYWEDGAPDPVYANAMTILKNGQTTLENIHWDPAVPTVVPVDPDNTTAGDQSSAGEALVVKGHARFEGNVRISHPQGDISMGVFGAN